MESSPELTDQGENRTGILTDVDLSPELTDQGENRTGISSPSSFSAKEAWPVPPGGILPDDLKAPLPARRTLPEGMTPWEKGKSGNPRGRPKADFKVSELARRHTAEAIETLAEIMRNVDMPANTRVAAANALLDRGHGRAPLAIKIESESSSGDSTKAEVMEILKRAADAAAGALAGQLPQIAAPIIQKDGSEILPPESKTPPSNGAAAFVAGIAAGVAAMDAEDSLEESD